LIDSGGLFEPPVDRYQTGNILRFRGCPQNLGTKVEKRRFEGVMPDFGARRKTRPRHQSLLISSMISWGSRRTSVNSSIAAEMA